MTDPAARAELAELHDELRRVARDLLGAGADGELDWARVAGAGWLGLEVAERLGGAEATFAEVCVILREMGRAAAVSSYLGTAVLGVGALNLLAGDLARELLQQVASGELRLAVALPTGDDLSAPFRVEAAGAQLRLHGRADFVPDAVQADRLLLLALDPAGTPVLVVVEPQPGGVEMQEQPVLDATRRFGTAQARGVPVEPEAVLRFHGDPDWAVRRLLDRGAVAIACDSLGSAEAMLDATVAYAGVRQQFGRFIGSFQAVKHACADMLVEVSVGRELLADAVLAVTGPQAGTDVAVPMAKSHLCAAAVDIVGKAVQLHGGYGYTWESGLHVYLKRVILDRSLFGSPQLHRRRISSRYR